jgi:hypothetical protein
MKHAKNSVQVFCLIGCGLGRILVGGVMATLLAVVGALAGDGFTAFDSESKFGGPA